MKEFRPAKKRVEVSVGESVRILRELQELSQSHLSELTGILSGRALFPNLSRYQIGTSKGDFRALFGNVKEWIGMI